MSGAAILKLVSSSSHRPEMVTVEHDVPFGTSCIWALQTEFFVERGPEAWKRDGVPSYITSNPVMASTYAGIIGAWAGRLGGPPAIVELGAGSGALAFRVLKALAGTERSIRYVMTDVAEENLAAWRAHPRLSPYVESGVLDFAYFDARDPRPLKLRESGEVLDAGSDLSGVAVLGNYFLDSIPQDLFYVKDGTLSEALCTVLSRGEPAEAPLADRLNRLEFQFSTRRMEGSPYGDFRLDALVEWYRTHLREAYVLVPAVAIGALEFLGTLAAGPLLGLFADKGRWRGEDLEGSGPPVPAHHGSFSIEVNFHAHAAHCAAAGGTALLPSGSLPGITVACFDYGSTGIEETYRSLVDGRGPEEVFRAVNDAIPDLAGKSL
ncbi:MAG TPA: hypothetical protein VEU28_04175, partial [Actinomycetota bacterium]|nr:hypothetical protein [Actinomycetota bacterium]